jgi:hypothetical protein
VSGWNAELSISAWQVSMPLLLTMLREIGKEESRAVLEGLGLLQGAAIEARSSGGVRLRA